MVRCSYREEETIGAVGIVQWMALEVQLLGREMTWYSVLKRDMGNGAEALTFRCLRTILREHDYSLVSEG